ncbi:hypothetical protein ACFL1B_05395 [Nanoarchaeota archaeon]
MIERPGYWTDEAEAKYQKILDEYPLAALALNLEKVTEEDLLLFAFYHHVEEIVVAVFKFTGNFDAEFLAHPEIAYYTIDIMAAARKEEPGVIQRNLTNIVNTMDSLGKSMAEEH